MKPGFHQNRITGSGALALALGIACCLLAAAGCSTAPAKPVPAKQAPAAAAAGSEAIQELNLLSMPMALNLDANPGADGLAVKLFANNASSAKTVVITEGRSKS